MITPRMMANEEPICGLELWQFSLTYDELPCREDTREYEINKIYRSRRTNYVYVYRGPGEWDCFVPK